MTKQDAIEVVQKLLKENDPEVVAQGFIRMYADDKIEIEDLIFLVDQCGFELDEEFVNMSREEVKKLIQEGDEEDYLDDIEETEEENKEEGNTEEGNTEEEPKEPEENRASKKEDYNGEKVYDKEGQPTQVETSAGSENSEENEKEKAQKLFNVSF